MSMHETMARQREQEREAFLETTEAVCALIEDAYRLRHTYSEDIGLGASEVWWDNLLAHLRLEQAVTLCALRLLDYPWEQHNSEAYYKFATRTIMDQVNETIDRNKIILDERKIDLDSLRTFMSEINTVVSLIGAMRLIAKTK